MHSYLGGLLYGIFIFSCVRMPEHFPDDDDNDDDRIRNIKGLAK